MAQTKICSRCNRPVDGSANFCPYCGASEFYQQLSPEGNIAPNQTGAPYPPAGVSQQTNAGYGAAGQPFQQQPFTYAQPTQTTGYPGQPGGTPVQGQLPYGAAPNQMWQPLGMKWFKFLIYFSLPVGAALNFFNGILFLSGQIYTAQTGAQVSPEMVYLVYPGMRAADILYGLFIFAIAGFAIFTRFQLAKYKANGPKCLYICYGAGAGAALLYAIASSAITGLNALDSNTVISIMTPIVLIAVNMTYFNKRKAMFVN